jgi:DNA-binding IclR family transcriptional regulator
MAKKSASGEVVRRRSSRAETGTGVPAIRSAAAILRFLHDRRNEPATMSQIARELGMNGSTCFNMLKTLEDERLLSYDPQTKAYELGLQLVELASVVDGHRQVVDVAMKWAARLVADVELTCLVVRPAADEEFLVIGKVESPKPIKVTVAVGTRFPPNAAVLAKGYYAFQDDGLVDDMFARHGLPAYVPNTITDTALFKKTLEQVRTRGYAESLAEYWRDHNALSSPIFDSHGRVSYLLALVGFAFELSGETIDGHGRRLRETAERITREIGGRYPDDIESETDSRPREARRPAAARRSGSRSS